MIFFIKNWKNIFVTIFYRFFGYDVYEKNVDLEILLQIGGLRNLIFQKYFELSWKKLVLIILFQLIVSGNFIHQSCPNSNNSQFFTMRIWGKKFQLPSFYSFWDKSVWKASWSGRVGPGHVGPGHFKMKLKFI